MKRMKLFLLNGLLLAGTSILLQTVGISFNVYISGKIGAEGLGLYQLVNSVYRFGVTLALSGVSFASTRMVAEELAHNSMWGARRAMFRCLLYSLFFGTFAACALYFGAPVISLRWLQDERTLSALRILAVCLPFVAMSSALGGYFTAVRRVAKSASAQILEQFIRMSITVAIFQLFAPDGLEAACIALVVGGSVSEAGSCLYLFVLYLHDRAKHDCAGQAGGHFTRRMLSISLPIALSTYLRSGLSTLQQLLIPAGLKKSGSSYDVALASYGVIQGMVMPVILFPSAFLGAFAGLLVPEMAECRAMGKTQSIEIIASRVIRMTLLFAIGTAGVLMTFSGSLGDVIYQNEEAGRYISILAPLVVVMYLDSAVDNMLKGLGEQMSNMRYNIIDSAMCVVLVYTLLPLLGIHGYLIVIFMSEIVNTSLSVHRLLKVAGVRVNLTEWVLKPALCIATASALAQLMLHLLGLAPDGALPLALCIAVCAVLYLFALRAVHCVTHRDFLRARAVLTGK